MFGKFSSRYSQSDAVTVGDGIVTKKAGLPVGETEARMTELAHLLAVRSDLFYAPKVLGFDEREEPL